MPRSKEISEDIRRKVVEAHESGKGYKLISKAIGLPKTTIRAILRKWKRFGTVVTLPRSGRPSKISPRARREIIREVMKNPCTTSKDLQATLASSNICVHQSTIRRILGIHGRPTLSSFEGSMALQTSSREEEGMPDASEGSGRDAKDEDERQVFKSSNADSDRGGKDHAKCPDSNRGDGEKAASAGDESPDEGTRSGGVNGAGGGAVEDGGGGGVSEKHEDRGEKRAAQTATADRTRSCDADDGSRHDAGYAAGREVSSAYSRNNNNNNNNNNSNNNNNNNGGNWSEEMDYISTLAFS